MMRVHILADKLREALTVAQSAVPTRATVLPVLNHVLIEAHIDGGVTVSGTDRETRSWYTVTARVDEPGSVTLPPRAISDFLDAVNPAEVVVLTVNEQHKAELVSGKTRIRLAGLDAKMFPSAPSYDAPAWDHTMPADVFAALVKSVAHAVAPKDDRPVLAGILVRVVDGTLTLVAADGFRLALRSEAVDAPDLDVIAQGKTLARAAGILSKATSVRLIVDERQSSLLVDTEVGCWSVRLLEGQFPDFNCIIPQDTPHVVTMARDEFLRVVRLVGRVEQMDTGYRAGLTFTTDSLEIRAGSSTADQESEAVIPVELERGEPTPIAFNTRYLREAIEAFDTATVTLEMVAADKPAILHAGDRSSQQILMPMHVVR